MFPAIMYVLHLEKHKMQKIKNHNINTAKQASDLTANKLFILNFAVVNFYLIYFEDCFKIKQLSCLITNLQIDDFLQKDQASKEL